MDYWMILFCTYIFISNSCIQRNSALYSIKEKCSDKRIRCLDNTRYRFCFRTSKSVVIEYGNIKYCPKSTRCCEVTGKSPCIKQENNATTVTFQMIDPDYEITKTTETTINNQSITAVNTTPFIQQYETFITTPTQPEKLLTTKSTTEESTKLTTTPTTERIVKIKRKKKPNKTKNKVQKSKRKTVLDKIKIYLNKLQKKVTKKKKHKKNKNPSTPNYKQTVQKVTTPNIHLFTKQHFSVKKKPVRKLSTKHPLRKVTPKIKRKTTTKRPPTKSTTSKPKQNKIKLQLDQIRPDTRTNDIPLPVTESLSEEDALNNLYTTDTIEVVDKVIDNSKVKIITNKPVKTSTFEDYLYLRNLTFDGVTNSSTISTTINTPSTYVYTQTSSPWIFTNLNILSTTLSTMPPQLSACSMPTKYRGAKCNEYYECVKVMWVTRLMLFRCRPRESFDAETLACTPNTNCY
ncbi:uncharacterized protein LOC126890420 [Diabrotica virgifera virgifera]|uniref:Chitin-binding type-2 domain-containing protein n=1 Tax=Diabrotica virgifera virgifera TaxID=50390 RepID=A0ABM5KYM3_DIAVI|nr:uncharacterized protein LOC126890420 [Diabrotica virgifera virgifera]